MKAFQIKNTAPFTLPLGRQGEMLAWEYLVLNGFEILEKNYRCMLGEIDVVARDEQKRLVFIEVKTRRHRRFGAPEEAVDQYKQRKLVQLAQFYLKAAHLTEESASFAVVSVSWKIPEPEIRLIRNAFYLDTLYENS